jgi:hypothetical protein
VSVLGCRNKNFLILLCAAPLPPPAQNPTVSLTINSYYNHKITSNLPTRCRHHYTQQYTVLLTIIFGKHFSKFSTVMKFNTPSTTHPHRPETLQSTEALFYTVHSEKVILLQDTRTYIPLVVLPL